MKRGRQFVFVILIGVFLVLSIGFVSAGLIDWLKDLFGGKEVMLSPEEGLIAHYSFENNVNDVSGNGNNGVNYGIGFVEGKNGLAGSFDGVNSYIEINSSDFDFTLEDFSGCAWIKISSNSSGGNKRFLSKGVYQLEGWEWFVSGDRSRFRTYQSGLSQQSSGSRPSLDSWSHMCFVREGVNITFYKDGVESSSASGFHIDPDSYNGNLLIGKYAFSDNSKYRFEGLVDELKIWNRAMDEWEVLDEYGGESCNEDWSCTEWSECIDGQETRICEDLNNCGTEENKPEESQECCFSETCSELGKECGIWDDDCGNIIDCGSCQTGETCTNGICVEQSNLVAYYDFEGDANDESGNNNHGTNHGATLTTGKIGQGYSFDGINDYIDIGNLESYFTDEATLIMWIKLDNNIPTKRKYTALIDFGTSHPWNVKSYYSSTAYPWTDNKLYMDVFRNNRIEKIDNSFDKSQWHMLTIVNKPGADGYKIYQDNNEIYSGIGEGSITLNSRGNELIGKDYSFPYYHPYNYYFDGLIDEVKIWNRALSESEIMKEYEGEEECIEDWQCTNWSDCINGTQIRTCNDLNNCGTENNKPEESQECQSTNCETFDVNEDGKIDYKDYAFFVTCFQKNVNETKDYCVKFDYDNNGRIDFGDFAYLATCLDGTGYKCGETDNGKDYYVKGLTANESFSDWDNCTNNTQLIEFYCEGDAIIEKSYNCSNNCQDGACIKCTPNCQNKTCGDDGCGGSCGECGEGESCINNECVVIPNENIKDLSRYSDKEVFLISDKNWREVLPLVPLTTWTSQEGVDESGCKKGYGTPEDVCVYPTLVWHSEGYESQIIDFTNPKNYYKWINMRLEIVNRPLFVQEINAKSFDIEFDVSEELLNKLNEPYTNQWGNEDYHYLEVVVSGEKPGGCSGYEEEWECWNAFKDRLEFTFNGKIKESYNPNFFANNFRFTIELRNHPWNNDNIKKGENSISSKKLEEDYLIKDVKIYLDNRHLNEEGDWMDGISINNYSCYEPRVDLCITNIGFSDLIINPGEEFEYIFEIENVKDSPVDLSENNYDLEINYISEINQFIDFEIISEFERKILNKGDKTKMVFKGRNTLSGEENFDIDSIIYFMQQYFPEKVTIIGETLQELDNLLIVEPELGAGLEEGQIQRINLENYLSYWKSFKDIVYVEDNYKLGLLASTYASLINAPLIIEGSKLDIESVFRDRNIICVGDVNPSESSCDEQYDLEELQQKYVDETNTDKIILVNPEDIEDKVLDELITKSGNSIINLYEQTSLLSPFMSAGKHELIMPVHSNDYDLIDNEFKEDFNNLFEIPESYSCLLEDSCSGDFSQKNKELKVFEKEFSFNVSISGKNVDLSSDLSYQDYVVNENNILTISILNYGKETATGVNVSVYLVEDSYYEGNERIYNEIELIGEELIGEIKGNEYKVLNFNWIPKEKGYQTLLVKIESDNDENSENDEKLYSMEVILRGADAYADGIWLDYNTNRMIIVNQENIIEGSIYNRGTDTAEDVIAKLYTVEGYLGELVSEIDSVEIGNLFSRNGEQVKFSWTPSEVGYQYLALVVESSNDINNENNIYYREFDVKKDEPYLEGWISFNSLIYDTESELNIYVQNTGIDAENVLVSLYLLSEEDEELKTVIEDYELGDIKTNEHKDFSFKWTPLRKGYFKLKMVIECDNGPASENIEYIEILDNKPDLRIYSDLDSRVAVINKEKEIPFRLYNRGIKATGVIVKLYGVVSEKSEEEILDLKNSVEIGEIDSHESIYNKINWTPLEIGEKLIKVVVESDGEDLEYSNNYFYKWINVFEKEGPDVSVNFWTYRIGDENTPTNIHITLENLGTESAEDFNVSFYDNGLLKQSFFVEELAAEARTYLDLEWTPETIGSHNLKVSADIDDLNNENNEYSKEIIVYKTREVLFSVKDSQENLIPDSWLLISYGEFNSVEDVTDDIRLKSGSELISLRDSNQNIGPVVFDETTYQYLYTLFIDSAIQDEMNIISEYYSEYHYQGEDFKLNEVYANKVDWTYNKVLAGLVGYSNKYLESSELFDIYFCYNWDFINQECIDSWEKADTIKIMEEGLYMHAEGENVEAFAIGESLEAQPKENLEFKEINLKNRFKDISDYVPLDVVGSGELDKKYTLRIPGFFYDCEEMDGSTKLRIYKGEELIRTTYVDCKELDKTLVPDYLSSYIEIYGSELDDYFGEIKLKFDGKLALSFDENLLEINMVNEVRDLFYDYQNMFECGSFEECNIEGGSDVNFQEKVFNGEKEIVFENVDTSKDYFLYLDIRSSYLNYEVYVNDNLLKQGYYSGHGYQNSYIDIPKELIQEQTTVMIKPGGNDYSLDIYLIPKSDYYLTIMASPNQIPIAKDKWFTNYGWRYMIKQALDPGLYADFYNNDLPDLSNGRIFGLTSSDVSSYIARDLFYDDLENTENMKFIASSFSDDINNAQTWSEKFNLAGYSSNAVTSEENCYNFDPVEWESQNLISYADHGSSSWAGINSEDIPLLKNSFLINDACSTCAYFHDYTFCTRAVRQGATGNVGTISVSWSGERMYYKIINGLYYDNLDLGKSFKDNYVYGRYDYQINLVGDPTFEPYKPYLLNEKLEFSSNY